MQGAVNELCLHPMLLLHEAAQVLAEMITVRAKCGAEQFKQAIPRCRRLRAEPLRDLAAVRVEDQPTFDRDAEVVRAVNANLG